jgi:hypothetical protein
MATIPKSGKRDPKQAAGGTPKDVPPAAPPPPQPVRLIEARKTGRLWTLELERPESVQVSITIDLNSLSPDQLTQLQDFLATMPTITTLTAVARSPLGDV